MEGPYQRKSGADLLLILTHLTLKHSFACEVKDFDYTQIMDRKEARKCDRYTVLGIAAAKEAIADSNIEMIM